MNKKAFYEAPEAEILVVKYEENLMTSPLPGEAGETVNYNSYDEDF